MCFKIMMIDRPRTPPPSRERILRTLGGSLVFGVSRAPVAGGVGKDVLLLPGVWAIKSRIAGGTASMVV